VFQRIFPATATDRQAGFEPLDAPAKDNSSAGGPLRLSHSGAVEQKDVVVADANAIAAIIRTEVDAGRRQWGDFLILTRKKRSGDQDRLGVYASALEAAGVPYEVSGSGTLLGSPHVEALILLVYALTHPGDGIALAALLRGPCFGLSDAELYDYRKSGRIFHLAIPISQEANGPVVEAIRTLQDWRGLTRRLPAGAAIEAILESSGLLARAAAVSAGGGEAGKLVYAVDKLRAACESGMTLGDAASALEQMDDDDESASPVLEPGKRDVVRLMNLHKAKGLEAKVVFLADSLAGVKPRATARIVRQGESAHGYLVIKRPKGRFYEEPVAMPPGWDHHEQEELEFQRAEESRLLYVASTRARETLIVSEWQGKPKGTLQQPWEPLKGSLASRPALTVLPLPPRRTPALPDLSVAARACAVEIRERRMAAAAIPEFETLAISSLATHSSAAVVEPDVPAGPEWGTLIHGMLEYAIGNLQCSAVDLAGVARWLSAANDLPEGMIPAALENVDRVRNSALWDRVTAAEERLTEVPLASLMERHGSCRTVAKGVIDLVLRFPDGWEIFDFKSDLADIKENAESYGEQVRTYAALWKEITGEPIKFAGLFSTRTFEMSADLQASAVTA
jgi:ATP-dependent helicase/nuclease subunit A